MRSIQRRLSLGLVSVLLVAGLVVGQVSLWLFETGLQRYLESGLQNDSENLLIALSRGPQGYNWMSDVWRPLISVRFPDITSVLSLGTSTGGLDPSGTVNCPRQPSQG